ncbi:replication protein [Paenibacillus sp. TAF43_2]|uniref:replication protein n=1 Tax=Paenibacillus sp. TAF43_2 TaxID=3233069 RepID=UPI003F98E374
MAGPQLEDGFTQVANEIFEQAARINLNGTQFRILLIVWRYTYGFKRKTHQFSLTFLAEALGTHKNQVQRELQILIERNILIVISGGSRQSRTISFNKDYDQWDSKSDNGLAVSLEQSENASKQQISGQFDPNLTATSRTKKYIYLNKKDFKDIAETEEIEPMNDQVKIQFHDTVFLTQEEYDRLVNDFGKERVDLYIEMVDEWQTNNPKKQKKDHNKTIRVWIKKDDAKKKSLYPSNQQQKQEQQMDVLAQFYEEGAALEADGNGPAISGHQNGVPELPSN